MTRNLGKTFEELGHILGVCPCCAELFYLSEARPYLSGKQPHSIVDRVRSTERQLDRQEENLAEIEMTLRQRAAAAGRRRQRRRRRP